MERGRPYADGPSLLAAAERAFALLTREDWLEAFSHHPRIGDRGSLAARFPATAGWSASEQGGVRDAGEDVLDALLRGNREYEARFGHIFIVCATGKTADEMLGAPARAPRRTAGRRARDRGGGAASRSRRSASRSSSRRASE